MVSGGAVVAIWNGIAPAGRAEFYDWHLREHFPERVAIPGFCRGRRFIAATAATGPEFFTLYEVASMAVLSGPDYAARLNAPTERTRRATAHFRDTSRALARVLDSSGAGDGGVVMTIRFGAEPAAAPNLAAMLRHAVAAPRVTAAHLCAADAGASGTRTAESAGRSDLLALPAWFAIIEATDAAALAGLLPDRALREAGARPPFARGIYRLEYLMAKPGA